MNEDSRRTERYRSRSKDLDDSLDRLLGEWGDRRCASLDDGDELRPRIISQLADDSPVKDRNNVDWSGGRMPRSSAWLLVGIASVVMVVVTLAIRWSVDDQRIAHQDAPPVGSTADSSNPADRRAQKPFSFSPATDTSAKALALIPATDASAKSLLLNELEQVFDGKLCWVAEIENDVRLGMCPRGMSVDERSAAVSVRLTVVRRAAGGRQWLPVWNMVVTTRSEQIVHVEPGGTDISLWVYRMPDGMLAVDSDVSLKGPIKLQTSYSGVQEFGVPSEIYAATIDDTEYAIFQTIVALDPADDVS